MLHSRSQLLGLLLGCSSIAAECAAQSDIWTRKNDVAYNDMDGPRAGDQAAVFAVGDKGYLIDANSQLWEYDPTADRWTHRSVFPGGAAGALTVCFSIGDKGYICKVSGAIGTWAFDPADGSWTSKASFPGQGRSNAVGFTLDGKGYLGTGVGGSGPYLRDFWSYDPATDSWTQRANFPGPRARAAAFAVAGKGYITGGTPSLGSGDLTYTDTTYEYDPVTNTWTQRANHPTTNMRMVAFSIGAKGYVGCGTFGFFPTRSLFAYDPATDSWTNKGVFGDPSGRDFGFAMAIGNKGYMGGGRVYSNISKSYNDLWCFDPATNSFMTRQYLGGMDLRDCSAFGIGATAHFIAGNQGNNRAGTEAWAYAPTTNRWSRHAYANPNLEASATFTIGTQGYKVGGLYRDVAYYSRHTLRYDAGTDTWSNLTAAPLGSAATDARAWAVGFSANGKGYVGLGSNGTVKNDLWQYDPAGSTWTRKADLPGPARQKAVAFRVGGKVYVGTGIGTTRLRDMWEYDPATDTWTQKADFGGTARFGAVAFAIGGKGYIATGDDGTLRKDLWEYDPVTDTWTQKADFGGTARRQAMAFVVGNKAYVGTGEIGTSACAYDMWEYTPMDAVDAVQLRPKVLLDGPYDSASGLMGDALRAADLVPRTEPYTALGYEQATSGGESTVPAVLAVTGNDAIVDWVVVELRHPARPDLVVASACALLQRDGDVVGTDGSSAVTLMAPPGGYHVAIRHRNHLGAMTAAPVQAATAAVPVDLTLPSTATYGTDARKTIGGHALLWAGDVDHNARIAYTGARNDRDPILIAIGGSLPTAVATGVYASTDVNLDGLIKYTGAANDRDPIFQNIGGSLPTLVRFAQLP
ncbi:MAG: hypothetical protein JST66_00145 [Bacteroidetes bacterium]|nr:hypothetical protein [Bacteroidota bacterium]